MSDFNLKEALAGAKVVTNSGDEVTQLTTLRMSTESKLVGVHEDGICTWDSSGKFDYKNPAFTELDLKMAPVMGIGFLYLHTNGHSSFQQKKLKEHNPYFVMCFDLSEYPVGFGL
jgi:hypothetical protein